MNKEKLTRNEIMLSESHQARLDELVANHPTINTKVAMIRALLDDAAIEQTKTVRLDQAHVNQIARLGNLLNQYARLAYTYAASGEPIAAAVLHEKIDKANRLLSEIVREVRGDAA
jgi:2-oxo-4-hydroxy-4-carboxy--5-ureidoimidazoline (OHCU) decarboxylase